jgi:DNA polymerase III subunit beta
MLVQKCALAGALRHLVRLLPSKPSMTALGHVRLEADGDTLTLTATNLTTNLRVEIPCQGKLAVTCVPARALLDFVNPNGADKRASVEFKPVEGGKIVVADEGSIVEVSTLPVANYPSLPGDKHAPLEWEKQTTWDAAEFSAKVGWAILAVGVDPTRKQLTGVYFADGNVVVCCDGHRMHQVPLPSMKAGAALVPACTVAALLHVLPKRGDIVVSRAGDVLRFAVGAWQLETTAMEEKFPPYEQVVPSQGSESFNATVERSQFARALAKIAKPTGRRASGVRMKWNGRLVLERDRDEGISSAVIALVETSHAGHEDFVIGADARYIIDALAAGDDKVTARFSDTLSPIRIDLGGDHLAVVMPMRI